MRWQTVCNLIGSLTLAVIVSMMPFVTVSAVEPTEDISTQEVECIYLVTEPDSISEDVYYVEDGQRGDPASFNWVDDDINKKSLLLDGQTQLVRLDTARVKELTAFTFSAWFKWLGNETDKEQRMLCFYKNKNRSLVLSPHNIDEDQNLNGIQLTLEDPQIEPISLHHTMEENVTSALQRDEWHHIAVSLSDTEIALYLDGTLYASQVLENFSVEMMDAYRLVIGSEFEDDAQFNGFVDNALLYTAVLDTDQIGLLAQNKEPQKGVKPFSKEEVLATKPYIDDAPSNDADVVRILGLSPLSLAILGSCVVLVIILSLVLSLYRKKSQQWPKEDHP